MIGYNMQRKMITEAIKMFPPVFKLQRFPGRLFRINEGNSFVDDHGVVMLYCDITEPGGTTWKPFAKGTTRDFHNQVVR